MITHMPFKLMDRSVVRSRTPLLTLRQVCLRNFDDACANIVIVPEALARHEATPCGFTIAIFRSELDHEPEKGETSGTDAGGGGLLNVPVAENHTCPIGNLF
jgi:hypothetical protein